MASFSTNNNNANLENYLAMCERFEASIGALNAAFDHATVKSLFETYGQHLACENESSDLVARTICAGVSYPYFHDAVSFFTAVHSWDATRRLGPLQAQANNFESKRRQELELLMADMSLSAEKSPMHVRQAILRFSSYVFGITIADVSAAFSRISMRPRTTPSSVTMAIE